MRRVLFSCCFKLPIIDCDSILDDVCVFFSQCTWHIDIPTWCTGSVLQQLNVVILIGRLGCGIWEEWGEREKMQRLLGRLCRLTPENAPGSHDLTLGRCLAWVPNFRPPERAQGSHDPALDRCLAWLQNVPVLYLRKHGRRKTGEGNTKAKQQRLPPPLRREGVLRLFDETNTFGFVIPSQMYTKMRRPKKVILFL